jgi:hypothetical protein
MLELAMAALGRDETPAVVLQHPQDLADFHQPSISRLDVFGAPYCRCGITLPFTCGGPSDRRERGPSAGETACYAMGAIEA